MPPPTICGESICFWRYGRLSVRPFSVRLQLFRAAQSLYLVGDFNEICHRYSSCKLLQRFLKLEVKGQRQGHDQTECYIGGGTHFDSVR